MKYLLTIKKENANEEYRFLFSDRPSIPGEADGKTIKDAITRKYVGDEGFDFFISTMSRIKDSARKLAKKAEGTVVEEEFGAAYLEIVSSADQSVNILKRALQTLEKIDENARYTVRISELSDDEANQIISASRDNPE